MGEWESESSLKCADCGATLHPKRSRHRIDSPHISQPMHYYVVGEGAARRMLCPACWTTTRIAPTVQPQGAT